MENDHNISLSRALEYSTRLSQVELNYNAVNQEKHLQSFTSEAFATFLASPLERRLWRLGTKSCS